MNVSLVIRGDGKGGRRAAQEAQAGLRDMGKTAKTAGDQVKTAASGQAEAIKRSGVKASIAIANLKKAGTEAGAAIKQGLGEAVREERRVGDEAERLGDRVKRSLRRIADNGGMFRILGRTATSEIARIKGALGSLQGRLASLGLGLAIGREIGASAQLDRQLLRTRQTAGMTRVQQDELRAKLWKMARDNGNPLDSLTGGFDKLVASGLSYDASKATIGAIDIGTTITGADSEVLASGLLAGASAYQFDLAKPGQALDMLEKMIVAGRAGNAELENLADIFARVGPNAQRGGIGFVQSLAMVETLSLLERQPERLATLADSTTRLFTNRNYMVEAAKSTGVRFFNKDGSRRDMLDVLGDMKGKYDRLSTDKQRMNFVSRAFGKADLDTQKGVQFLLSGNNLDTFRNTQTEIGNAKGVVANDLVENRQSTTAVAGRMRNTLREAMDRMSQPINKAMADAGSYLLDDLNLTGGQMVGLAAGTAVAGNYAGRLGKFGLSKLGNLVGGGMDTVKNIAVGKALQDSTGVMPVYVTNWAGAPQGGGAALPETAGKAARTGGFLAGLRAIGLRLSGPAALAALPLARYWGTLDKGMQDETLQADVASAQRRPASRVVGMAGRRDADWLTQHGFTQAQYQEALLSVPRGTDNPVQAARDALLRRSAPTLPTGTVTSSNGVATAPPEVLAQQMQQAAQVLETARRGLEMLLGRPLQVDVRTDVPWLHGELSRSVEREGRRG